MQSTFPGTSVFKPKIARGFKSGMSDGEDDILSLFTGLWKCLVDDFDGCEAAGNANVALLMCGFSCSPAFVSGYGKFMRMHVWLTTALLNDCCVAVIKLWKNGRILICFVWVICNFSWGVLFEHFISLLECIYD